MALVFAIMMCVFMLAGIFGLGVLGSLALRLNQSSPTPRYQTYVVGVVAYIGIVGYLLAVDLATKWAAVGMLAVGAGTTCFVGVRQIRRSRPSLNVVLISVAAIASLALIVWNVRYLTIWNTCDDDTAYSYLVGRMLDDGGLIDPYNQRRLVAMGAGTAVQAIGPALLSSSFLTLADLVIGGLLVGLVVVSLTRKPWTGWIAFLAAFLVVVSPTMAGYPINSTLRVLPVGLVAAALNALYEFNKQRLDWWPTAIVVGGAVGTLVAIRPTFPLIPIFVAGVTLLSRTAWKERLRCYLMAIAVSVAIVGGYSIALYRSSGSLLFPLMPGTYNSSWPGARSPVPQTMFDLLVKSWNLATVSLWGLLAIVVISVVAFVIAVRNRDRLFILATVAGVFLTYVLIEVTLPGGDGNGEITLTRYTFPATAGALIFFCAYVVEAIDSVESPAPDRNHLWRQVLAVTAVVAVLVAAAGPSWNFVTAWLAQEPTAESDPDLLADHYGDFRASYGAVSEQIPPGSNVLAAVDLPGLLNFSRYNVSTLDIPGATSPSPQLPALGSPQEIMSYLHEQNIDVVVATNANASRCLYNQGMWEANLKQTEYVQSGWAPYVLNWDRFITWSEQNYAERGVTKVGDFVIITVPAVERQLQARSRRR